MRRIADIAVGVPMAALGAVTLAGVSLPPLGDWLQPDARFGPRLLAVLAVGIGSMLVLRGLLATPKRPRRWSVWPIGAAVAVVALVDVVVQANPGLTQRFTSPDYASLLVLQMTATLFMARRSRFRALGLACLGLLLGLVGSALVAEVARLASVASRPAAIDANAFAWGLVVVADAAICLASPRLFLALYARQVARWKAPHLSMAAGLVLRLIALVALAGVLLFVLGPERRFADLVVAVCAGVFGVAFRLLAWNRLVFLVAFAQAPILDAAIRQSLLASQGAWSVFIEQPISRGLLALSAIILSAALLDHLRLARSNR